MNILRSLLVCVLCFSAHVCLAAPGDVDPNFAPDITGVAGATSLLAVASQPDGKLIIGGKFVYVGGVSHSGVARLNSDGSADPTFAPPIEGWISAIEVQPDGRILIGGQFSTPNGYPLQKNLARLFPDGGVDFSFNPVLTQAVTCMALQRDGKILIGGDFPSVNGASGTKYFARLNADGTVDSTFQNNVGTHVVLNHGLVSLAILADGQILMGGRTDPNFLYGAAEDGGVYTGPFFRVDGGGSDYWNVSAIAVQGDGKVLIDGHFLAKLSASTLPMPAGCIRFASGGLDTSFVPDATSGGISVQTDGGLLVGGSRLHSDGSIESSLPSADAPITNTSLLPDGTILAAGVYSESSLDRIQLTRIYSGTAVESLIALPNDSRIRWLRAGTAPELRYAWFELSTDGGANWTPLGFGKRIDSGWELSGIALPAAGKVRARGRSISGLGAGLLESFTDILSSPATQPPTLLSPTPGRYHLLPVSYFLPEVAFGGSTKITLTSTGATYVLSLAPDFETDGAHSLSLDPANLMASPAVTNVTGGSSIPDGPCTISVSYRDWFGNPVAKSADVNVVIDTAAQSPQLSQPVANGTYGRNIPIAYQLPEAAKPGTAKVLFTGPSSLSITVDESAGPHTTSIDPWGSSTYLLDGVYTVSFQYQDLAGNLSSAISAANVTIDTVTAPPILTSPSHDTAYPSSVPVTFTLSEDAAPGSLTLSFGGNVLQLASAMELKGTHSFSFDPRDPTASAQVAAGAPIPDGTYAVTLSYQDSVANPSATASQSNVAIDAHTAPPTLTQPSANSTYTIAVPVSFALPEPALPGSVTLTFSDGQNSYESILSGSQETVGTHSFGFNPVDPTSAAQLASGVPVPNGVYTVTLSYRDAVGNAKAGAAVTGVTLNVTVVNLAMPANITQEATSPAGAFVTFSISTTEGGSNLDSLSVNPPSGSIFPLGTTLVRASGVDTLGNVAVGSFTVTVTDTTSPAILATEMTVEATSAAGAKINFGTYGATDIVGVASATYSPPSGTTFPLGTTNVSITARDAANNVATGSFAVHVVDTTPPSIATLPNLFIDGGPYGAIVKYDEAVVTDAVKVANVTYSKPSSSFFRLGATLVTVTAQDTAGNTATKSFTVQVEHSSVSAGGRHTIVSSVGDPVPMAGTADGPPDGAVFSGLGSPAIDADAAVVYAGTWRAPAGGRGSGIFTYDTCLASSGHDVPGGSGATYRSFGVPTIGGGRVAFLATLDGGGRDFTSAVMSGTGLGDLSIVARTGNGDVAPDTDSARFKKFISIAVDANAVAIFAQLATGAGVSLPTAAHDTGIWIYPTGNVYLPKCVLREGDQLGNRTITKLVGFIGGADSPGQGRGWLTTSNGVPSALALVSFDDRTQAIVKAGVDGSVTLTAETIPTASVGPGFRSVGLPTLVSNGDRAFLGTFVSPDPSAGAPARAIHVNVGGVDGTVARVGAATDPVNLGSSPLFLSMKDPVLAADDGIAFTATIGAGPAHLPQSSSIWWQAPGSGLALLAQSGGSAPLEGVSSRWNTFKSLGIAAHRGPVFTATLKPGRGISSANNQVACAVDANGDVRMLFRTGNYVQVGGGLNLKVKSFTFLNASVGTTAMTRSFNDAGQFVWLGKFDAKSQAIILTEIP